MIMGKRNDKFGINMKQWCREHESEMMNVLAASGQAAMTANRPAAEWSDRADASGQAAELRARLEEHQEKIRWLQHERLVHLIVTVMVVFVELFVVFLALLHPELGLLPPVIMLCLAVLLGFYFYHYFFLENTVQRWYKIAEELERITNS